MATKVAKKAADRVVFDDYSTQADDAVSPHSFAEVTSGPEEGRYGAVLEMLGTGDILLRTRDDDHKLIVVAPENLKPANAGRR
jgi:hypothetical protein